jgi:hypothetical protein
VAALSDSETLGSRLDAFLDVTLDEEASELRARATGEVKRYLSDDLFALASADANYSAGSQAELATTAGIGYGRFRDVTPLGRTIAAHDALLDAGVLIAPLADEDLLEAARTVGRQELSTAERVQFVADVATAAGVVRSAGIDSSALLLIQETLEAPTDPRLCGWEAHASLGATLTAEGWSAVFAVVARAAVVPDPVTQLAATVRSATALETPLETTGRVELSGSRRLAASWVARIAYEGSLHSTASSGDGMTFEHDLSLSLHSQISPQIGVSATGSWGYRTGDEEPTIELAIDLTYAHR